MQSNSLLLPGDLGINEAGSYPDDCCPDGSARTDECNRKAEEAYKQFAAVKAGLVGGIPRVSVQSMNDLMNEIFNSDSLTHRNRTSGGDNHSSSDSGSDCSDSDDQGR